ncbi:MAG: DNA polymerase III subunit delta' [Polyangiaceae bacterium]|nr:DNA polymerase III subunit delta' [Polyangiaceae bacterium]
MPFSHILGQDTALITLKRALCTGRVHHAYRFEGPDGVGKEMAAFALAQALVCTSGDPLGCGTCDSCRRAITLADDRPRVPIHPDVRIVERGLYPPDTIGQRTEETRDISVNQIRTVVLANAQFPPHEGRARVFIVRAAEEMSIGAANAILKTLEEPRRGTHFILLTARPDRLLPTIRSRTLPLRFAPLSDEIVAGILTGRGVPKERQDLAIDLAAGSASAAISLTDAEESAARDTFIQSALTSVSAQSLGNAVMFAESGDRNKDALRGHLRALAAVLAREARAAVSDKPVVASRAAARYSAVQQAIVQLDRNASPVLVVTSLVSEMQRV